MIIPGKDNNITRNSYQLSLSHAEGVCRQDMDLHERGDSVQPLPDTWKKSPVHRQGPGEVRDQMLKPNRAKARDIFFKHKKPPDAVFACRYACSFPEWLILCVRYPVCSIILGAAMKVRMKYLAVITNTYQNRIVLSIPDQNRSARYKEIISSSPAAKAAGFTVAPFWESLIYTG